MTRRPAQAALTAAALVLTACGAEPTLTVDPALQPAVQDFLAWTGTPADHPRLSGLTVTLGALPFGEMGECRLRRPPTTLGVATEPATRAVTVSPDLGPHLTRAVVAHELAHCLFDTPHAAPGDRLDLMAPVVASDEDHWRDRLEPQVRALEVP